MADTSLEEIPLPTDSKNINNISVTVKKKTAKEMLHEALVDHRITMADGKHLPGKEDASVNNSPGASSQSIVDELFKDFISQKFGGILKESHAGTKSACKTMSVDNEISKLLDMEISSIKSKTVNIEEQEAKTVLFNQNVGSKKKEQIQCNSKQNILSLTSASSAVSLSNVKEFSASTLLPSNSDSSISPPSDVKPESGDSDKKLNESNHQPHNAMLPLSVAKKLGAPKLLKMKLSLESVSLIQSNTQVNREGRILEEGEVSSSPSMKSNKYDSDSDANLSETGSINSKDSESHGSRHKKKRKHKHKKKKKKSSKSKSREDRSRSRSESREVKNSRKDMDSAKEKSEDYKEDSSSISNRSIKKSSRDGSLERGNFKRQSKEKHKKRKKSRSRSRTPKYLRKSRSNSRSRSSSKRKDSTDSDRKHYSEWDARRYSDTSRRHSKSKETDSQKGNSRDRSRSPVREQNLQIDKDKLRRIAIANALSNMKSGQGPKFDLTAVKSGGKSVEELTEFCKKLTSKDKEDDCLSDDSEKNDIRLSDDELIHHPFKVKEPTTANIVMNIKNAKQLPVLTPSEKQAQQASLRLTFPVSSGSHHRASESGWVPVEKPSTPAVSIPPPVAQSAGVKTEPANSQKKESIFPDASEGQQIDISSIITERLQAVRKLQENPYDVQALTKMHQVQEQASKWAVSRNLPGQFLGSTGAHVLSQEELMGDKRHQAWAKKTQLVQASPVSGGIGMFLLQKMGWKQGEGLGKNKEGSKVPLMLDIKIDRKGLTAAAENLKQKVPATQTSRAKDLSNKHPVSALMELCNKRRWGPPIFTVIEENGPDHKKNFRFRVKVNNVEYQPSASSLNKKTAKAQCAAVCLQEMGLIPRDAPMNY